MLKVFGCHAYYHVKNDKLDLRAKKAIFFYLQSRVKGYKRWDPSLKKTIISHDVSFDEASLMKPKAPTSKVLKLVENSTIVKKTQAPFEQVITCNGDENDKLHAPSYSKVMVEL